MTPTEISATWEDGVEQWKICISIKIALVACTGIDLGEFVANLEVVRDLCRNKMHFISPAINGTVIFLYLDMQL